MITPEQIQAYVGQLTGAGMEGTELFNTMYDAANQYGVSNNQIADAMGWDLASVDAWVNQNKTPMSVGEGVKSAMDLTQAAAGYTPDMITAPNAITAASVSAGGPISSQGYTSQGYDSRGYDSQGYTADQIANRDLNPYLNPYTQNVIDTTMGQMERAQQGAINNLGFAASRAGAFGGSRHGVAEGTSWGDYGRNVGQMAANLNQANMQNAFNLAGQDVNSTNQAGQFTANAANQASQFGASAANQAAQFGANAANQASQFGAGAANAAAMQTAANQLAANQANAQMQMQAQQLNAANQLQAALANQSAGLAGANLGMSAGAQMGNLSNMLYNQQTGVTSDMLDQGNLIQGMDQAVIDNAMAQFDQWATAGDTGNQLLNNLLGIEAGGSSETGYTPGLTDFLGMYLLGRG